MGERFLSGKERASSFHSISVSLSLLRFAFTLLARGPLTFPRNLLTNASFLQHLVRGRDIRACVYKYIYMCWRERESERDVGCCIRGGRARRIYLSERGRFFCSMGGSSSTGEDERNKAFNGKKYAARRSLPADGLRSEKNVLCARLTVQMTRPPL